MHHGKVWAAAGAAIAISVTTSSAWANLSWATFIGGAKQDSIRDVVTDMQGFVYVAGGTESGGMAATPGSYDTTFNGKHDVWVAKFTSNGALVWSTFVGGPNYDRAYALELDPQGNLVVCGRAGGGFPVTSGAAQSTFMGTPGTSSTYGEQDAFFFKLTPDGKTLLVASYFGGSDGAVARDCAVDASGNIYLATNHSVGAATPSGWSSWFKNSPKGATDAVIAKFAPSGKQVLWARYVGGSADDYSTPSVRVDALGNPHLLLWPLSVDMPTTAGTDQQAGGLRDGYLTKLSPDGTKILYGTYIGGSGAEFGDTHNLAIDSSGNAYVAATTMSQNLPVTAGALQPKFGGAGGGGNHPGDGFVAKLSPTGSLSALTYIGGTSGEGVEGVSVDTAGNVYFGGGTYSKDFPVTAGAFSKSHKQGVDAFASVLSADFKSLVYSTYIGGSGLDDIRAAFTNGSGSFYAVGVSSSADFPVLNAADATQGGNWDGTLMKFIVGTGASADTGGSAGDGGAAGAGAGGSAGDTGSGGASGAGEGGNAGMPTVSGEPSSGENSADGASDADDSGGVACRLTPARTDGHLYFLLFAVGLWLRRAFRR